MYTDDNFGIAGVLNTSVTDLSLGGLATLSGTFLLAINTSAVDRNLTYTHPIDGDFTLNWDYSTLQWVTQDVDTFVSVSFSVSRTY